jgi:hypothetical protein
MAARKKSTTNNGGGQAQQAANTRQKAPKQLAQQENGGAKTAPSLTGAMRRSAESTFRWTGGLLGIERAKLDALLA